MTPRVLVDIPPGPPPKRGCAVDPGEADPAWALLLVLWLARGRRRRA